jgi:hypothetical protein
MQNSQPNTTAQWFTNLVCVYKTLVRKPVKWLRVFTVSTDPPGPKHDPSEDIMAALLWTILGEPPKLNQDS